MAYADKDFYKQKFHGDVLDDATSEKWLEMASDELDALTHGRLITAFPTNEVADTKVRKAVCAVADALFLIDVQRQAAAAKQTADGSYHGAVASISSGKESVSYSAIGAAASVYATAAANAAEQARLIGSIACKYLANIPDANGVNLLYAGW